MTFPSLYIICDAITEDVCTELLEDVIPSLSSLSILRTVAPDIEKYLYRSLLTHLQEYKKRLLLDMGSVNTNKYLSEMSQQLGFRDFCIKSNPSTDEEYTLWGFGHVPSRHNIMIFLFCITETVLNFPHLPDSSPRAYAPGTLLIFPYEATYQYTCTIPSLTEHHIIVGEIFTMKT